ncbi:MAG TPA: carboxymuconolactone decarboxylase family protein [Janthinobacterium sp.]|nr:carboxymuconolactone decarboxylase family protein [Janthinobacterium sp.]
MTSTESHRYDIGIQVLKQVGGANYAAPLTSLQGIAPDLARLTVEFGYGDIMSRKELDLQTRQLCTVVALAAMGNAQPQLKYHIAGALNVGCDANSVIETIFLCAVFAGFPATINAVLAAKEVFQERGLAFQPQAHPANGERYERGMAALEQLSAGAGKAVTHSLMNIAPDFARFLVEFSYGDILSRTGIDNRTKELAIIALLTAKGTATPQLKVHIGAALNVGVPKSEIVEVIQQMAVYAGFPAALNGIFAAKEVFFTAAGAA